MTLKQNLLQINEKINDHANKYSQPYLTFAIFGIITYPFYYYLWKLTSFQGYENLQLRLITVACCMLLALKNYWPKKCKPFFPLFWYITLLYSLPFLFTFLLLKNDMSYMESMNTMTVLVLSILLLDLAALLIILIIGITFGIGIFILVGGTLHLPSYYMTIFITYASVLFFGAIFSYRKDQLKEREKRLAAEAAKSDFISNMQHDLATPFSGIHGSAEILYCLYAEKYPELKEWLEPILASCTQWEKVHYQILESIQFEQKPQKITIEKFYISEELQKISEMMSSLLRLKNLQLIIPPHDVLDVIGMIETDRLKFHLILLSLISNAINFTEKGIVSVTISKNKRFF
jgi:signal transduction histidine kinase